MITPQRFNAALVFAMMAHGHQMDFSGIPYIMHPIRVAETVMRQGAPSEAVVAALLHDVVEDTEVTPLEIKESFGDKVYWMVDLLTRKQPYYDFITRLVGSGNNAAIRIKLADIEDNMRMDRRTGRSKEGRLIERYAQAQERLLGALE